ncbi:MAG: biotin/lipoyl-binding protein [Clostridia bacterium]
MKRVLSILCMVALCLSPMLALAAFAETANAPQTAVGEELLLSATVQAKETFVLQAPASGVLAPFTVRVGDVVQAGSTLFAVEAKRVYADVDGVVADVYIKPGDVADAAVARYGAALKVEYADRYELQCSTTTGYSSAENRDLYVGTKVYLRSANEKHFANGVITAVSGRSFTVQVLGGDLIYTQDVKVYRTEDYDSSALLARASLSVVAPYAVSAAGTVTEVAVKAGDAVRAGDFLFAYVPDALDSQLRGKAGALLVKADEALVVTALNAQQGASVQKDQALASYCVLGAYELVAQVEEGDVNGLHVGDHMTVRFEELALEPMQAVVRAIGALGSAEDMSRYSVYLDFEAPVGVMLGMHATVERVQ